MLQCQQNQKQWTFSSTSENEGNRERPGSVPVPATRACAVESQLAAFLSPGHVPLLHQSYS